MTDYSDMESPKQRRERIASTLIWFLVWTACAAPMVGLGFWELGR